MYEEFWTGETVDVPRVLEAREQRAELQRALLARFGRPLLCFGMNIAGPVKDSTLIRRGFAIGLEALRGQLARRKANILYERILHTPAGSEAFFAVDAAPLALKELACELEEDGEIGRLFDMDVLCPAGAEGAAGQDAVPGLPIKLERQAVGKRARGCLICGAPGRECASRRLHSAAQLQERTAGILLRAVRERECGRLAEYAQRALLYETAVTPKPGLVDRANCGSHRDMDFYTFLDSCAALRPYWEECARTGWDTAGLPPEDTFRRLRPAGRKAECRMLLADGGVNTHKGAIFSLGIVTAAAGRLAARSLTAVPDAPEAGAGTDPGTILAECARMTKGLTGTDFPAEISPAATAGERLHAAWGITGVRGQAEAGFPAVAEYGLPLLKKLLAEGKNNDQAGAAALMTLIAHTTDTCLIHRGGMEAQREAAARALAMTEAAPDNCPSAEDLRALDRSYIAGNLSPGGCADLLTVCWFLHMLETRNDTEE